MQSCATKLDAILGARKPVASRPPFKREQNNLFRHQPHREPTVAKERRKIGGEGTMSVLNKLTEANYVKLLGQTTTIDTETVLKKAFVEHRYIPLYARLLTDLKVPFEESVLRHAKLTMVGVVEGYNRERRLTCGYDEFCDGNVEVTRASGINLMAIELIRRRALEAPPYYDLVTNLPLNEASLPLIRALADSGGLSGRYARRLNTRLAAERGLLSNKTRFGIEDVVAKLGPQRRSGKAM